MGLFGWITLFLVIVTGGLFAAGEITKRDKHIRR
jgi:hypothetical protein